MRIAIPPKAVVAVLPILLAAAAIAAEEWSSDHGSPNRAPGVNAPARRPQTIQPNDILEVTISDLAGPDESTGKRTRVGPAGAISLPFLGGIKAEGLTPTELEVAIRKAYNRANLIQNAQVIVKAAGIAPVNSKPSPRPLNSEQRARMLEICKHTEEKIEKIQGQEIEEMARISVKRDDNDLATFQRKLAELRGRTRTQMAAARDQSRREIDAIGAESHLPATVPAGSLPGATFPAN